MAPSDPCGTCFYLSHPRRISFPFSVKIELNVHWINLRVVGQEVPARKCGNCYLCEHILNSILRSLNCSYLEPQSKDFNLLYKYKGYQKTEFFKAEMKLRRVNPQQATDLSKLLLGYVEKASIAEFFNQADSQD